MKLLVIGPGKLKFMPYLHFYLDNINHEKYEVHIAYWNRDMKNESTETYSDYALHEYRCYMVNNAPLKEKFWKYKEYRKFVIGLIRKYKFDKLIVLHSLPGIMIVDKLVFQFSNRFVFDYRDSTFEEKFIFRFVIAKIIKASTFTFTSSDGFRKYFPSSLAYKIFTSHNLLSDSLNHRDYAKKESSKIRIAFWGFIRHVAINKTIIEKISSDQRFELHYYGREQKDALELKEFAKQQNANNVFFHGEYNPDDRYEFVKNTDILHNSYLDTNTLLAMGNKYYDGIIFRIPQLCMPGSIMGQLCEQKGIGVSISPYEPDYTNKIFNYYNDLNLVSFNHHCDAELERIMHEYHDGIERIESL